MQQLPSGLSDKTKPWQKGIAFALMAGAVYLAAMAINALAPTLLLAFKNIYYLLLFGTPLTLATLYIAFNPLVVWGFFKTLSWNLTKFLIKMDPLSVMDRYADYLEKKRRNLEEIRLGLSGKEVKLERLVEGLRKGIDEEARKGSAALEQGEKQIASLSGTKVATDRQTLTMYEPILKKIKTNVAFLGELSENWDFSIKKLRYTIDRKREEYENLREMAKALDQAEDFARGDTDASKLYNESVKQLEITASNYIAKIEDFEKNSKTILGSIRVEKQMIQDEGLAAIEAYRKNGSLMLPDFSNITTIPAQEVVYTKSTFKLNS